MGRFGKFLWLAIGNFFKLLGDSFFGFMTNRTGVCSMKNSYKKDRDCYKKKLDNSTACTEFRAMSLSLLCDVACL